MSDVRRLLCRGTVWVLAFCVGGSLATAQVKRPSPPFEGERLPEPPRQTDPWLRPDVDLPQTLLSATATLLQQGLADPRGGEYREIEIGVGSAWAGDAGVMTAHGWVLPAREGERQRFAVCWNGLVYPVVSTGEPADVEADIRAVIEADEKHRAQLRKTRPDSRFSRSDHAWPEGQSASHKSLLPIKVCLLLRLGHGDLAKDLWTAWLAGIPPRTNDNDETLRDPYLRLARDWTWAMFDRALCAHMRGDDRLALLSVQALVPVRQAVEEEATRRNFSLPLRDDGVRGVHLSFLGPLDRLLEDQRRRAKQPPVERVLQAGIEKFPEGKERIAALVRDLEEVSARQWGQPGGVSLGEDAVVAALVREGEAAVEPLIDCLEGDERLTRSVRFHRDFFYHREVLPVDAAAFAALTKILDTRTFGPQTKHGYHGSLDPERRRAVAEEIQALWERTRGAGPAERWYRLLADDEGDPIQWVEAADRIVQAVRNGKQAVTPRPLQGEPLRIKKDPSVTELMVRRADELTRLGRPGSEQLFNLHRACRIALSLATWEAAGRDRQEPGADERPPLPTLRALILRCRDELTSSQLAESWTVQILGRYIAQMTLAAAAGDQKSLTEYAAWIRTVSPAMFGGDVQDVLEPLWRHSDHPAMAAAADWLFDDERSPWYVVREAASGHGALRTDRLLRSPLIGLPAMRRQLLRELGDRRVLGSVQVRAESQLSIRTPHAHSGTQMRYRDDPLAPPPETEVEFRVCDYVARALSPLEGTPLFELYWPVADRDAAIARCADFLRQWGERFRFSQEHPPRSGQFGGTHARFTLPQLDRPATPEDVQNGRAIFSLADSEQARAVPLEPFRARWTTLKQFPSQVQTFNPQTGERAWITRYDQEGWVWQAEETLEEGRRVRYYGFVGRYIIAKVPSEEVERLEAE